MWRVKGGSFADVTLIILLQYNATQAGCHDLLAVFCLKFETKNSMTLCNVLRTSTKQRCGVSVEEFSSRV